MKKLFSLLMIIFLVLPGGCIIKDDDNVTGSNSAYEGLYKGNSTRTVNTSIVNETDQIKVLNNGILVFYNKETNYTYTDYTHTTLETTFTYSEDTGRFGEDMKVDDNGNINGSGNFSEGATSGTASWSGNIRSNKLILTIIAAGTLDSTHSSVTTVFDLTKQ